MDVHFLLKGSILMDASDGRRLTTGRDEVSEKWGDF
jgi:hypothetical protein